MSYLNKYSIVQAEKLRDFTPLIFIAVINAVYFAAVIALGPGLQTDDFVLFGVIKDNPYPVCLNPNEHFFFFVRPFSYFTFWLDSVLWLNSPACMRIFSLMFHFLFLAGLYLLLFKLSSYFQIRFNRILAASLLLLLTFHLDTLIWINWISNRTELLYIMFYTYSVLFALDYLAGGRSPKIKLFAYAGFYVLSILSKAQPLHLPLLVVFLLYVFKDRFDENKRRVLIKLSLWLMLLIPILTLFNWLFYSSNYDLSNILWRKPFSMAGVWLFVLLPSLASNIYEYFLNNKLLAVTLAGGLLTALLLYLMKHKDKVKMVLGVLVFNIIIFFPRISAEGSNRINSIQIFWLLIALYFLLANIMGVKIKVVYTVFLVFAVLHVQDGYSYLKSNRFYTKKISGYIEQLRNDFDYNKKKVVILASYYDGVSIPYQAFYEQHKYPGRANIVTSPVLVSFPPVVQNAGAAVKNYIKCEITGNEFIIQALSEKTTLVYYYTDKNAKAFPLVEKRESKTRGLSYLRCKIPERYLSYEYTRIYFDGNKWKEL